MSLRFIQAGATPAWTTAAGRERMKPWTFFGSIFQTINPSTGPLVARRLRRLNPSRQSTPFTISLAPHRPDADDVFCCQRYRTGANSALSQHGFLSMKPAVLWVGRFV